MQLCLNTCIIRGAIACDLFAIDNISVDCETLGRTGVDKIQPWLWLSCTHSCSKFVGMKICHWRPMVKYEHWLNHNHS